MASGSTSCAPKLCMAPVLFLMLVAASHATSPQLATISKPFNCSEQYTKCKHCLQMKWTQSKLGFCCKSEGIGCKPEKPSKGSILLSAANTSKCVYFKTTLSKGLRPWVSECSKGEVQPTRFQLPEGNMGPIKVAEDPSLCLNAPGHGVLRLWPCDTALSKHRDFTLQTEPSGWIGVPHFDLADEYDAESMDASDLKAVIKRAEEFGYAGFSVFGGRAFLKNVKHLTLKDLNYMGKGNPNVFYIHRKEQSSDVSIRLTWQPNICILLPTKLGESQIGMAPCWPPNRGSQSAMGTVWTIGMLFQLKGDITANTGDDSNEKESTPMLALNPVLHSNEKESTPKLALDPSLHSLRFLHQQQPRQQQQQGAASVHWQ